MYLYIYVCVCNNLPVKVLLFPYWEVRWPVSVTEQLMSRVVTVRMRVSLCTPQSCMPIISGPSVVLSFHGNSSMRAQK